MIEKLDIENFMLFEKLEIPTLKRVNLIGGRNNSGKTVLLGALRIILFYNEISVNNTDTDIDTGIGIVNKILNDRQLLKKGFTESYDRLFYRKAKEKNAQVDLKLNDFIIERLRINEKRFFKGKLGKNSIGISFNTTHYNSEDKCVFLPYNSDFNNISTLWEKVVLTPMEDTVFEIIRKTISPEIQRLDVGRNIVRVKLDKVSTPVPLGTLGDGVQRILLIALGLANAKNSYLLIDEIELGLHHSVLEKLWKMIFKYAKKWNIQVFVTTHSQDAIKTFTYVASEEENKADAQFIRLQIGRTGKNEAILFDTDRLTNTLDLALEIR